MPTEKKKPPVLGEQNTMKNSKQTVEVGRVTSSPKSQHPEILVVKKQPILSQSQMGTTTQMPDEWLHQTLPCKNDRKLAKEDVRGFRPAASARPNPSRRNRKAMLAPKCNPHQNNPQYR